MFTDPAGERFFIVAADFGQQGGGGRGVGGADLTSGCGDGQTKRKKGACGKLVSSNRACKSWMAIFTEKKAPAASW